ncbi:PREDICTED: uncharacterized protein LOC108746039 [Trachymyrmex septentrionalis]|uniref:uncharacterized protein LOC108746039 n=1 Tax=Trachymyrmex septentrionalis TaxID=34720 RepID=UPI00084F2CDE|nr:PREDICTED: uncharacterized protein LOC108746039 [Trachymyrmex septentrionalis]
MLSIISTFSLAKVSKHDQRKAIYTRKERLDSIKNSKKSTISPHQHKNNKIDGNRNYSMNKSVMISDEKKNSAALNRFLEDVLNAQNDLQWIDHVTRHINHRTRLNDPLAHTNQHSTVSINTRNILERDDIGYGSRLRGKRGFDRNYETMWMLQKKYGRKSTRDVPQRVYLDNDMTFNADNALYQSHGTRQIEIHSTLERRLDRAVYEEGTMVDQPLKDWTGKKNFHSSRDWSNSNENPKVTNGKSTWLRDYESPENLVNSDSNKNKQLHTDLRDQFEVSLHDPIHDLTASRRSVVAIRNGKTRNVSLSLESLKRTVLELRDSLMLGYKRKNIIPKRESNWWDEPRSTAEMYNFREDLDNYLDEETMRRLKRAKNVDNKDENDSKLFPGVEFGETYFEKRNSKESHDRSKRSRRSFVVDSNYINHQKDIPENNPYRKIEIINNVLENITTIRNTAEVVTELYSSLSNDGKNSMNASNKMNITDSQNSLDKGFFSNNYFNNLTITPSKANKTNIFKLKYSPNTELYLNDHFFVNKSLFVINTDLQTHLPKHITKKEVPNTSLKKIGQRSTIKRILKTIDHTAENPTNSPDFEKSAFTNLIDFSINDSAYDSGKSLKYRSDGEKLGFAAQKISQLSIDDEQSKGVEKEFPQGNMSHGFGIGTNESWSCVVTTTVTAKEREIEADGTQNREPIPGVIKIFEPRGRLYQKQEAETTTRLSRQMGKDGTSVPKMKTNEDEVDESRNTNAREDSLTSLIDSVTNTTMKPETAYINIFETGESIILKDLTSVTVDNDLRKQQQMVPPLSVENSNANKSNGNLDTDKIDIRVLGSNGNETMNVKEGTRTIMEAHEYHKSDNNLQRKLLWVSTISVDGETGDSSIKSMGSVFSIATESHIDNVSENRQQNKITDSANFGKILIRTKREDEAEKSRMQDALNSQIAEINRNARYKQSVYPYKNIDTNNEAENTAVEKEAPINYDESNEEYQNQNVEELKGLYNDRQDVLEDVFTDNDKAMERNKEEQSSFRQQIDPVRTDMLIKQKLDKKRHKDSRNYRRKRHSMLDMVEYYDYDDNEEQKRDATINEQEAVNKDNKFSINAKIKRAGKSSYKSGDLGKKKNEHAEAVMKEELRKAKAKYKEPKEEIIVDLGKNKTTKKDQSDKKTLSSLGSSFENVFNEERQLLPKDNLEKIRQSKDFANNVYHEESAAAKSKWLDQPFEDRSASSKKNSELLLEDNKKETSNEPLKYISIADVNTNVDKNILLDIQPINIMDQSKELETSKEFYEDFGNDRSEDYYYQENDSNNVEFLYEELKNLYDWPDSELKSRPRLRGDQRLRYESDGILDTNPSQLQPLNDRFLSSSQNNKTQKRFQSIDASLMSNIEQSSTEKNLPSSFSVRTTAKSKVSIVSEDKNVPLSEGRPVIDTDSETSHENTKYIESKTHESLKRNLNLEKQSAISSQDLYESFVESPYWYDDSNVKVRLGRELKATNDTIISDLLNAENATSLQTFHDNSSKSQNWHNNTITNSFNIFNNNNNHNVPERKIKNVQESILMNTVNMDGDDLEGAEQKYVNNQTRIRRAAISYRTFYDNLNQNQHDYDEMSRNLGNQFHSPNIVKNQFDEPYDGYQIGNSDTQNRDQYSKIPRANTRKKKSGKGNKKNKHFSKKHAEKNSSHSSSNRNRKHHIQQSDMSNWGDLKQKNKAEVSPLIKRTKVQKSKTAEQGLLRARMNEALGEKVFYGNQSTVKPEVDDVRRKEITLLLAADNIDDESQMDVALHGELAGKIVEQIFEQVQKNDRLKSVLGPGLQRDRKTEDVIRGNIYQQGLDKDGTNHTETMKKVMGLLDTLILNEVQKKTCVTLSPDMREFLGWMLEMDQEKELLQEEEAPPLPLVREKIIPEQDTGRKFLFDSTVEQKGEGNINDLQTRVKILETLVKEYNALPAEEKTKVQAAHDYLIQQLNLLLQHIEARETAETRGKPTSMFGAARGRTGNVLQYKSAVPNTINANHSMTKDAFSLPIDSHNLIRFNNSFETIDKQLHDSHVAFGRRETRSIDNIPSKRRRRRKTKRQRFRNQKKKKNHRQSRQKHNEHHRRLDHVGSSLGYKKSRQKRANPEEKNDQVSLYYLSYEKPKIYDSFDLLDAKLKRKRKKRKLIGKKNATIKTDRILDLLPIKGKNRMEDEVILLNKREGKKENEEQLEEVAFGKDMRNSTKKERERFEKLTEGDKHKPPSINETSFRMKREDIIRKTLTGESTDRSNKSHAAFKIRDGESWNNSEINNVNGVKNKNKLELVERRINVFANNKTDAAIDSAATEVSAEEKLATNGGANNQIKGKLRAINRETKIDKANGSTSFVNLTRNAKPRVSEERQKVSVTEKEADDNAVKLNRATNYRREEIDPEIELKNLRQGREKKIYDVANWKTGNYFYDDDNLSRNKLREKYMAKLDELGDLDTDPENNFVLLRLRNNKWLNDVEWKLLPIIKQSPYDDYALPRIRLIEKETPVSSDIKDVQPQSNSYLIGPKFWQRKHRKRNSVFDISPIFKITDSDHFPRKIRRKAKRASEIARFKDLQVDPKIILKIQRLSRPWNNKRSNGVAEFRMPFVLKNPNREFREIFRSRNHPEPIDDRVIYDAVGLQLPVWPYQYYDDFTDSSTFHFVPDIHGRSNEVYQYPAETYFEYGPFKKHRAHDANWRFARRNTFRSEGEDTNNFPTNNLTNKSLKSRFSQRKFRVESATAALANGEDYFVSGETKYTGKNARKIEDKTKTELTE